MELMACIKALRWVRENQPWSDVTRVQIVTDSTYVTDNISYRARGWKKNKWRNRFGKPMANDDLWNDLLAAHTKTGIRVDFVWQPGKKSATGKIVDKAAKAAAQRGGIDKDRGYRPGAVCRSLVEGGLAQPYPARGQSEVIRPYAKKVMFRGENRISFNIFVEGRQSFEAKFYAFATPAMAAELHRWHGYRVRFNDDPNYPRVLEHIEEILLPKSTAKGKNIQP
jgi:ribonuclease HI